MLKPVRAPEFAILLAENNAPATRVQVLRTGKYKHPQYGDFEITKANLDTFVTNFSEKVRDIDIAVDYKHDSDNIAAAWFKSLAVEPDPKKAGQFALFADVEWTPKGLKVLSDKEFRYLSADFTMKFVHNETGKNHGPVLLGAGLTNRPFVSGMEPVVQLSETGVNDMTLEQALEEIKELKAKLKAAEAGKSKEFKEKDEDEEEKKALKKKLSETEAEVATFKLAETKREEEKKLGEKKATFDKMLSEKKVCEAQRAPFMEGDFAKFSEAAAPAVKTERESKDETKEDAKDVDASEEDKAAKEIDKQAGEKMLSEKIDYTRAVNMVLSDPKNKDIAKLAGY